MNSIEVNIKIIWKTVIEDLPGLEPGIRRIIADLGGKS